MTDLKPGDKVRIEGEVEEVRPPYGECLIRTRQGPQIAHFPDVLTPIPEDEVTVRLTREEVKVCLGDGPSDLIPSVNAKLRAALQEQAE